MLKFRYFIISLILCCNINTSHADNCYINYEEEEIVINDPLEKVNRQIYHFNNFTYHMIVRPVASLYNTVIPAFGRQMVNHALINITKPVSLVNNLLQGNVNGAMHNFWQFTINSTIGIGGLNDVASYMPLEANQQNFSKTLKKYGMKKPGAYLMLPIIGPSNMRDFAGLLADIGIDPITYIAHRDFFIVKNSVNVVNNVAHNIDFIDDLTQKSIDPYIKIRALSLEKARSNCSN